MNPESASRRRRGGLILAAGQSVKRGIIGSVPKPQFWLLAVLALAVVAGASGLYLAARPLARHVSRSAHVLYWSDEGVSDLASLDPALGPDFNTRLVTQLIFGGLVRFGPNFRVVPDCALSWTISDRGRVFTFHLRPHIRFADGTPLVANDVAYSLNRVLSPKFLTTSGHVILGDIRGAAAETSGRSASASGITVLDSHTVRIQLVRPSGSFLARLATPAGYIIPRRNVIADPTGWANHAFGTGPFRVDRWIHGDALLLGPNRYYYGGVPKLTGIDTEFIPEPLEAYKRFRAGAVDIMGAVSFPTEELFNVRSEADFHHSPKLETVYLTLNERRPPLNQRLVRRALLLSINQRQLVQSVFAGFAKPATGMVPTGLKAHTPGIGLPFDPRHARELLAKAGFSKGHRLPTIHYMVNQDSQSVELASFLASQWRRNLGVSVHLVQRNHNEYNTLLQNLNFDIAVIDWTDDYPDPSNFLSQLLRTGSPNNNGGWSNRTFDRLTERADAIDAPSRQKERTRLYMAADRLVIDDASAIPLVYPYSGILLRPSVRGIRIEGGELLAQDWATVTVPRSKN